ncbi:MAG: hypothetical protein ABIE74_03715 [Pseudomonadota bacterium]
MKLTRFLPLPPKMLPGPSDFTPTFKIMTDEEIRASQAKIAGPKVMRVFYCTQGSSIESAAVEIRQSQVETLPVKNTHSLFDWSGGFEITHFQLAKAVDLVELTPYINLIKRVADETENPRLLNFIRYIALEYDPRDVSNRLKAIVNNLKRVLCF